MICKPMSNFLRRFENMLRKTDSFNTFGNSQWVMSRRPVRFLMYDFCYGIWFILNLTGLYQVSKNQIKFSGLGYEV